MLNEPVSVVIITYNSARFIEQCLSSLHNADGPINDVLVVDNCSTDDTLERVRHLSAEVQVLANERNLGYAAAVNIGVKASDAPLVIVANADVLFHQDSISRLAGYMYNHQGIGIAGPQQVFPTGQWQRSYGDVPGIVSILKDMLGLTSLGQGIRRLTWPWLQWDRHPKQVGYVDGAVLAIRRQAFEKVGGFDERFFFYAEEADFCHRLRQAGWGVIFLPMVHVTHVRGGNSTKVVQDSRFLRLQVESSMKLVAKYNSPKKVTLYARLQEIYCRERVFLSTLMSLVPLSKVKSYGQDRQKIFSELAKVWRKYSDGLGEV